MSNASKKFDFIDAVRMDARLTFCARWVAVCLLQHYDHDARMAYISQADIAAELGCSERHVKAAVAELVDNQWLRVERRGRRNFYVLLWAPKEERTGPQNRKRQGKPSSPIAKRQGKPSSPAVIPYDQQDSLVEPALRSRQQAAESLPVARERAEMSFRDILRTTGIAEHNLQHVVESLISMGRRLTPGLGWRLRGDFLRMRHEHGSTDDQIVIAMAALGWAVFDEDQDDRFVDAMPDAADAAEMVRAAA